MHDVFNWMFERHQNVWSWYVRPLFLIPFCFFAYKRSAWGIILTLVALLSSMFWFPKPRVLDAEVQGFLEMEKEYLTGNWPLSKILLSSLVPLSLFALALAFWKRSWKYGLILLNFIAVAKVAWSVVSDEGGMAVVAPALVGLLICDAAIAVGYFTLQNRRKIRAGR
ncbi:hypothetical protein POL68_08785 [Stigmatella sp. ncwal1]|uniref:Transmembrane protein n=1 Tax=Stigmatella ashevillensis TaxID=2995309 RepID=A0ABT5D4G7_9BACT|nr:hypothetical protein [Stigmatella ashevillena]MDC0708563.1 hypothetical protein [Stigmatella ashevillena]